MIIVAPMILAEELAGHVEDEAVKKDVNLLEVLSPAPDYTSVCRTQRKSFW